MGKHTANVVPDTGVDEADEDGRESEGACNGDVAINGDNDAAEGDISGMITPEIGGMEARSSMMEQACIVSYRYRHNHTLEGITDTGSRQQSAAIRATIRSLILEGSTVQRVMQQLTLSYDKFTCSSPETTLSPATTSTTYAIDGLAIQDYDDSVGSVDACWMMPDCVVIVLSIWRRLGYRNNPHTQAEHISEEQKILVDVEAYHSLLIRACYNNSDKFDAVRFVKNVLLKKFAGIDVEFFFDGDGNAEKFRTGMQRRGTTSDLDAAEARIRTMEEQPSRGHGIKKADFKIVQKALTDLMIRRQGWHLLDNWIDFVVVGNDCDYAIHPTTSTLLQPSGKKKFIQYDISALLSKERLSRAQYQALGVVSKTGYSGNLPRLGIVRNTKIIKSISNESDSILHMLNSYGDHPDVKAAKIQYEQLNEADRPEQLVDFSASRRISVDSQETPLTTVQRDIKRFREYQRD
ncbi:hypothetical protein KVV02_007874 [Mortierella alpina]|uniref:Uncharacterized protein n=1 Tax=Mortierella alpina TaxID=64518 RepID=A0A9P8A1Y6_MORAP|nr:hypothetical protein KVV02_007874 [Mortierella alpina]